MHYYGHRELDRYGWQICNKYVNEMLTKKQNKHLGCFIRFPLKYPDLTTLQVQGYDDLRLHVHVSYGRRGSPTVEYYFFGVAV